MSPIAADLRTLLETEQETALALEGAAGVISAPEAQACLDELHFTLRWFCAGLGRHVRRPVHRTASDPGVTAILREQLRAAPTGVDRIRLITRTQRSVLARVESMLAGSLGPDLRTLLEQARAVLAQSIHCCEEAIASLDRQREVHLDADR
jgi:hypothetical protein